MTRLPDIPALDALLADPRRVAELPAELVPALLDQLAVDIDRRDRLRALLLDRLRPTTAVEPDQLLDVEQAAARLAVSVDWLRRQRPPYRVQLSEGIVRYSARGIDRFLLEQTRG